VASVGTVTVNVEVGDDLEAAIRQIVRDEIAAIAQSAADLEANCSVHDCQIEGVLSTLAMEARALWDESV